MRRKTMPTTTGVTTIGTISTRRIARMNGNSRRHRSASPRPSSVSIATAAVTNLSVVQSAPVKSGSSSAWRYWSKPTFEIAEPKR